MTFPCPAAVRGGGHGGDASAVWVQAAGLCGAARGWGAAFEGGAARRDAGPGGRGGDRCARCGAGWCEGWPGPGWRWPAPSACRGDAAGGRGCVWSWPVAGRGRISCLLCWGGCGQFPGISPALDAIGVPDHARSSPAVFPGVVAAARLSRRAAICWPARARDGGCPRGLLRHDRRARGPPFSFPLIFREKKELTGKEGNLDDGCGGHGHRIGAAALRRDGPGRGAWPASLQAAWLREPGSGVRARPGARVLR